MGYKRKAHILFVAENFQLAEKAAELGNQLGNAWLECRAVPLAQDGGELLHWADLLVTLDSVAQQNHRTLPPATQHRHCPCPDSASAHDCLTAHIHSLIGGMKMLGGGKPPPIR